MGGILSALAGLFSKIPAGLQKVGGFMEGHPQMMGAIQGGLQGAQAGGNGDIGGVIGNSLGSLNKGMAQRRAGREVQAMSHPGGDIAIEEGEAGGGLEGLNPHRAPPMMGDQMLNDEWMMRARR